MKEQIIPDFRPLLDYQYRLHCVCVEIKSVVVVIWVINPTWATAILLNAPSHEEPRTSSKFRGASDGTTTLLPQIRPEN